MHRSLGALVASRQAARSAALEKGVQLKSKGQRGLNSAALVETHKQLVESLSAAQFERLHDVFVEHGKAMPGFITAKELGPLLKSLGDRPRPSDLQGLIAMVDADGNALIDFEEFLILLAIRSHHRSTPDQVLDAFALFDPEDTGTIPLTVFRTAMQQLSGMADDELEDMINDARIVSRQEEARRLELKNARAARRAARKARRLREAAYLREKEAERVASRDRGERVRLARGVDAGEEVGQGSGYDTPPPRFVGASDFSHDEGEHVALRGDSDPVRRLAIGTDGSMDEVREHSVKTDSIVSEAGPVPVPRLQARYSHVWVSPLEEAGGGSASGAAGIVTASTPHSGASPADMVAAMFAGAATDRGSPRTSVEHSSAAGDASFRYDNDPPTRADFHDDQDATDFVGPRVVVHSDRDLPGGSVRAGADSPAVGPSIMGRGSLSARGTAHHEYGAPVRSAASGASAVLPGTDKRTDASAGAVALGGVFDRDADEVDEDEVIHYRVFVQLMFSY